MKADNVKSDHLCAFYGEFKCTAKTVKQQTRCAGYNYDIDPDYEEIAEDPPFSSKPEWEQEEIKAKNFGSRCNWRTLPCFGYDSDICHNPFIRVEILKKQKQEIEGLDSLLEEELNKIKEGLIYPNF